MQAWSGQLHGQRHGAATPQTQRRNAPFCTPVSHGVDELDQNGCTAGTDGMAKRYCSAVDVDAGLIEAEFTDHRESLYAEGLIQFEKVDRVERPTRFGDDFAHRIDGR